MLLGQHIKLYTRHKTLPVKFQFGNSVDIYTNTQGVQSVKKYISSKKNVVAGSLSQFPNNGNQHVTRRD